MVWICAIHAHGFYFHVSDLITTCRQMIMYRHLDIPIGAIKDGILPTIEFA